MGLKENKQSSIKDFEGRIIQGDCLQVICNMPDNSIDLVLTDPP